MKKRLIVILMLAMAIVGTARGGDIKTQPGRQVETVKVIAEKPANVIAMYTTTAWIKVNPFRVSESSAKTQNVAAKLATRKAYYMQLATSDTVLRQAVNEDVNQDGTKLDRIRKTSWFTKDLTETVKRLRDKLAVKSIPDTHLIAISLTGPNPKELPIVVNALTEALVDLAATQNQQKYIAKHKGANARLKKINNQIVAKQKARVPIHDASTGPVMRERRTIIQMTLQALITEITQLRLLKAQVQAALEAAKTQQKNQEAIKNIEAQRTAINERLLAVENQYTEESQRLKNLTGSRTKIGKLDAEIKKLQALASSEKKVLYQYNCAIYAAPLRIQSRAETPPKPRAKKTLTLNLGKGVAMKLVLVPAGDFMMGGKFDAAESVKRFGGKEVHYASERPRRKVTISKPFYMGVYEVTQAQWEAVMDSKPYAGKMLTKIGPDYPVSWVTWREATEFCEKLSKQTGRTVSLPSEAQWEYACRAGSKTAFCYGDDPKQIGRYGWLGSNMIDNDKSKSYARKGGRKKPNALGVYDMHGNVWEWCRDWYSQDFYAGGNNVDPVCVKKAKTVTARGGSWYNDPIHLRSAARNSWTGATYRHYNYGFRVIVK